MPLGEGQCHGSRADQEAPAHAIRPWSHSGTRPWSYYFDRRARREACITVELLKRDQIAGYLQHCRGLVRPAGRYTRLRVRDVFHDGLSVACRVRKSPESVGDVDSAHHIETATPFARAEVVSTGKGLLDRVAR